MVAGQQGLLYVNMLSLFQSALLPEYSENIALVLNAYDPLVRMIGQVARTRVEGMDPAGRLRAMLA